MSSAVITLQRKLSLPFVFSVSHPTTLNMLSDWSTGCIHHQKKFVMCLCRLTVAGDCPAVQPHSSNLIHKTTSNQFIMSDFYFKLGGSWFIPRGRAQTQREHALSNQKRSRPGINSTSSHWVLALTDLWLVSSGKS